ncbi:MAG: response regulator [Chitinophagales bacterium]|nr:response regulator [Chitinophagales bacterium]
MAENTSRKVFLVDDDPSHNQMLKDHLTSKLNVDVTTFSTGEDCLRNLDKNPNVIVLDYNLNSEQSNAGNGLDILKKVKSTSPATEVIMLSGQEKIQIAVETMKHGAFDYVIKNESAFLRTQNVINNIFKGIKLQENLKAYKLSTFFLAGVIVLIIVAAILLVAFGIAGVNDPTP